MTTTIAVDLYQQVREGEEKIRRLAVSFAADAANGGDGELFQAAADQHLAHRAIAAALDAAGLTGTLDEDGLSRALQVLRAVHATIGTIASMRNGKEMTTVLAAWTDRVAAEARKL